MFNGRKLFRGGVANVRAWRTRLRFRLPGHFRSLFTVAIMLWVFPDAQPARGQPNRGERMSQVALAETPASAERASAEAMSLPWLELIFRGGWLMVPIGAMSVIVVAIGIERAASLRRARIAPVALAAQLQTLAVTSDFDPRTASELCRQYPSALGRVVLAMLHRSDRPANEIEQAATEACQRESDDMYGPIRTINLATSVAPLLGLLGTVLGMIQAFFATANLVVGANRSQALAEGIYVALVTTFAGLSVAIPAAVLAHCFESRIVRQLRSVEQIALELLPQIERSHRERADDAEQLTTFDATSQAPRLKAS